MLEDSVARDHPVRVIDAFVESLDLGRLGFGKVEAESTGRPPYHPGDLLKLYVYGYLNRLRSSRVLERECKRNIEVIWLLGRLAPDFKTIANFRKDNGVAIRRVCSAWVMFCGRQGLVGGEVVAVDGSKFQAAASGSKAFTGKRLKKVIGQVDEKIEQYLKELDQIDATEQDDDSHKATATLLETLKRERAALQALAEQMAESGEQQIVAGEADAALMGHRPTEAGYNVQTAIDAKHKLIVHHDVVRDANDRRQLYPMASATKEVLKAESLVVLADAGYHNAEQSQRCENEGIEPIVPAQRTRNQQHGYFPKEMFVYDSEHDIYRCPADQVLAPRRSHALKRQRQYVTTACGTCMLRTECTSSSRRRIRRTIDEDAATRADQRARKPGIRSQRSGLAEHPFAWLKRTLSYRFLSRGAANVKAEVALAITAFNILRAINTIGAPKLLRALHA